MSRMRRCNVLLASLLLIASPGCGRDGPERGAVEGTVTFNGEPVTEGSICFTPTEGTKGPTAGGALDSNGHFVVAAELGPVVGKQRVSIVGQRKTGRIFEAFPGIMWEATEPYIPEKYNAKSELVVEVHSGINKYKFELEGEAAVSQMRTGPAENP